MARLLTHDFSGGFNGECCARIPNNAIHTLIFRRGRSKTFRGAAFLDGVLSAKPS
jgi:hypothetical protein